MTRFLRSAEAQASQDKCGLSAAFKRLRHMETECGDLCCVAACLSQVNVTPLNDVFAFPLIRMSF